MYVSMLERFSGYTLDTLRAESAELMQFCNIVELMESESVEVDDGE